jgi:hypothetical protein
MSTYTVQHSDTLSSIAHMHGFRSWETIYDHPDNAGFRRWRPNRNLIFPGDIINIPELAQGADSSVHPGLRPGVKPMESILDDKCCFLATRTECPYSGQKSNYTCPSGYAKQHWVCTEGSRMVGCGECVKNPSTNCWTGPFHCSIWWYM